jgi:hypothetical protein
MTLDQTSDDVQAQAGALAHGLCSEKRIEDAVAHLSRDAMPIINDPDHHKIPFLFRDDFDLTTFVHSIQSVIDKVRPDLIEFAAETVYGWKIFLEIYVHADGFAFCF